MESNNITISCNQQDQEPEPKRLRSVKEYREKKKLQKTQFSNTVVGESASTSSSSKSRGESNKNAFKALLNETVSSQCASHFDAMSDKNDTVYDRDTLFCGVSAMIYQALLEKESRLPEEVRFNVSDRRLKDAALRRIISYTSDYLQRKYPR